MSRNISEDEQVQKSKAVARAAAREVEQFPLGRTRCLLGETNEYQAILEDLGWLARNIVITEAVGFAAENLDGIRRQLAELVERVSDGRL